MKALKTLSLWGLLVLVPILVISIVAGLPAAHAAPAPVDFAHLALGVPLLAGTTLAEKWPTLLDVAQRTDPDGKLADIVEILAQHNPILHDAPFFECNDGTGHKTTVRTGYPEPTWRKLYGGSQPVKSTTAQVRDGTGMLETYGEVDKALADMAPEGAPAFRLSEETPTIAGFGTKLARSVFYENEATTPEAFTGLSPRFGSLAAENKDNIVDAGGTGSNNASVWLINWGKASVHMLYPRGSKAGLSVTDKGQVTVENVDGQNGRAEMYRTHYRQDAGLCVRDWRNVARIANVDVPALATLDNTKKLIQWMVEAAELMPDGVPGRKVFYMPRRIRTKLRLGILEKIATNLTWETVEGRRVMVFDDIPVERCDALLLNEARVV